MERFYSSSGGIRTLTSQILNLVPLPLGYAARKGSSMKNKWPKPFGYPIAIGLKHRVAKKHINRLGRNMFRRFREFDGFELGAIVCTCTGYNTRVISVEPSYIRIGKGWFLYDLNFETDGPGCSMYHCGVSLPRSLEEIEKWRKALVEYYSSNGDVWGFVAKYSKIEFATNGTILVE